MLVIFLKKKQKKKKKKSTMNAGEGVEEGNPPTLLGGMQTSTATMENSVEIP